MSLPTTCGDIFGFLVLFIIKNNKKLHNKDMKQTIKLNESELRRMIAESVRRVLNEGLSVYKVTGWSDKHNAPKYWCDDTNWGGQGWVLDQFSATEYPTYEEAARVARRVGGEVEEY